MTANRWRFKSKRQYREMDALFNHHIFPGDTSEAFFVCNSKYLMLAFLYNINLSVMRLAIYELIVDGNHTLNKFKIAVIPNLYTYVCT